MGLLQLGSCDKIFPKKFFIMGCNLNNARNGKNTHVLKIPKWPSLRPQTFESNALINSHPRGLTPGNPRHLHQGICKFHLPRAKYSSTKSYHCPSTREHNLKGLQNCTVISCIIFNKSLTIINTVTKNSQSTCFLHTAKFNFSPRLRKQPSKGWLFLQSALYLVSHRMTISTNIHILWPVFTMQRAMYPVPTVRIFHFQDDGDVTNPPGLSPCILPRKCKSSPMPPSRAKNWRKKSANPMLFPPLSSGVNPPDGR